MGPTRSAVLKRRCLIPITMEWGSVLLEVGIEEEVEEEEEGEMRSVLHTPQLRAARHTATLHAPPLVVPFVS